MEMGVAEIRNNMADALNRVAYQGERIVLERRGKGVAAIVSMEDLALLEALEDREDVKAARRVLAEMKRKGGTAGLPGGRQTGTGTVSNGESPVSSHPGPFRREGVAETSR